MKNIGAVIGIVALVAVIGVGGFVLKTAGWFVGETVQVGKEEFGPRAMLRKYEWFKDQAAALNQMRANINASDASLAAIKETYGDLAKAPRDVRQDAALTRQETVGLKFRFNALAAEYNSNMAKFNYRFANAGSLPEGATEPLPREFAQYVTR